MTKLEIALLYLNSGVWNSWPTWLKKESNDLARGICECAGIEYAYLWGPRAKTEVIEIYKSAARKLLKERK